jgi:AcrR family transcriptional regulator
VTKEAVVEESRRERRRRETRERVEAAALELFTTQDYELTTMDQIAERADIARRTLFNHFPRKRDILEVWTRHRHEQLSATFAQERFQNLPTREQLAAYFTILADVNAADPALARVIATGRLIEMSTLEEPYPVFEAFRLSITRGQAAGEITDSAPAEVAAEVLSGCYYASLQEWLIAGDPDADSLHESLRAKLDLVLDGLAKH